MKLHYDILWFEDNTDFVLEDFAPRLKEHMEDLGFELSIDLRDRYVVTPQIDCSKYDLIISDLNLPGATPSENTGKTIVQDIRNGRIFTEVILYSENAELLKNQFKALGLIERASFQAGRREMFQKVINIVELTVRKVQTVNNARGLVVAETIDLESKMEDILIAYFKPTGDTKVDNIKISRAKKFLDAKAEFTKKSIQLVESYDYKKLESFCEQKFISTFDFIRLLGGIISDVLGQMESQSASPDQIKLVKELSVEFNQIESEVNSIRNTMAHVKAERIDGKTVIKNRKANAEPIVFDDAWCATMRKNLRKHSTNLDLIQKHLGIAT